MNKARLALLALTAMLADRIRGGYPEGDRPKWVKYLAMTLVGPCLVLQEITFEGEDSLTSLVVLGLSMLAGPLWMWRQDNGYKGQWVEGNNGTITKGMIGAARWGLLASIPMVLLSYWNQNLAMYVPAFIIGNVLAHFAATVMPKTEVLQLRHAWPWSELLALGFIISTYHILGAVFNG